jgi:hypothetical protein
MSMTNCFRIEKLNFFFVIFFIVLNEFRKVFFYKINELVFRYIHDILYRKDLNRKYKFKKIDGDILKRESLNSPGVIQFCELE